MPEAVVAEPVELAELAELEEPLESKLLNLSQKLVPLDPEDVEAVEVVSLLLLPENKLLNQLEKVLVPVDAVAEGVVDAAEAAAAAVDDVDEEDLKSPNKLLQKLEVLVDVALGLAAAATF